MNKVINLATYVRDTKGIANYNLPYSEDDIKWAQNNGRSDIAVKKVIANRHHIKKEVLLHEYEKIIDAINDDNLTPGRNRFLTYVKNIMEPFTNGNGDLLNTDPATIKGILLWEVDQTFKNIMSIEMLDDNTIHFIKYQPSREIDIISLLFNIIEIYTVRSISINEVLEEILETVRKSN